MQQFTIRDMEHLCNIKAHTLRIWEQRYDLFRAKRKESQHRIYDNEDLRQLLRIAFLYHGGWKISRIAALNSEAIREAVLAFPSAQTVYDQHIIRLLDAVASFDEPSFSDMLQGLINKEGLENTVLKMCYPFLQRVGLLWMTSNIIPAQEHFASYLIQHKIIAATDNLPQPPAVPERCAILFAPPGEHHELPLLFLHYLLRKNGWSTIFLGANQQAQAWPETLTQKATHLFFHLITNLTGFEVDEYLEMICKKYPGKTIVATGSGIQSAQRSFVNARLLKTDAQILAFMHAA
jgi:MerR family transcriptional regulator, light-induced transcriptional regulator